MKKFLAAVLFFAIAFTSLASQAEPWRNRGHGHHRHHGHDGVSLSFGFYSNSYGRPYYPAYYYPPYYPTYYAAPATTVIYNEPARVVYASPGTTVIAPSTATISANQTSDTYIDSYGRTCREYQSGNIYGTACLQHDGTWRVIQ